MINTQYTSRVLEAYEDEVAGAAYFDGLALAFPEHSVFFRKCAVLERTTANRLTELLRKYQLTPRAQSMLEERGAFDARLEAASDCRALLQKSIKAYARYVADFEALEAVGPAEDQPVLAALTAHEVELIGWMRAEIEL
jgi:2-polyprenyl-6-methoxyphenol hydroxylase-like FAD-dependent oxidoreductase